MYNEQANLQEATDTLPATLSTEVLTRRLTELLGDRLVAGGRIAQAAEAPASRAAAGAKPCEVIVACALAAGKAVAADWIVMAKVSKTSNLIWLFTGQLIRVSTGEIVLDDSTELKGDPDQMVRVGSRIFAERVARTVRAGGVVNNFPTPDQASP
jgi:hypothetical protein